MYNYDKNTNKKLSYKWINSIHDCEIAEMPEWMIKLMIKLFIKINHKTIFDFRHYKYVL